MAARGACAAASDFPVFLAIATELLNAKPTTKVEATSILPSLNVKTARSWRGILPSTHLAREGRMTVTIGRRELLVAFGGAAAAWPLAARGQQSAMPVVGFFYSGTLTDVPHFVAAFRQGLKETDFIEGQNVVIEYRSAEDQADPLPALVADLARRQVALIVGNTPSTLAAKAATTTVPIVFVTGFDPVRNGLVTNLNRPGGNVTGISFMSVELAAKSWRSCVSCGREPRALPCSSIPNSPLPSGFSQRSGLRLRPSS